MWQKEGHPMKFNKGGNTNSKGLLEDLVENNYTQRHHAKVGNLDQKRNYRQNFINLQTVREIT